MAYQNRVMRIGVCGLFSRGLIIMPTELKRALLLNKLFRGEIKDNIEYGFVSDKATDAEIDALYDKYFCVVSDDNSHNRGTVLKNPSQDTVPDLTDIDALMIYLGEDIPEDSGENVISRLSAWWCAIVESASTECVYDTILDKVRESYYRGCDLALRNTACDALPFARYGKLEDLSFEERSAIQELSPSERGRLLFYSMEKGGYNGEVRCPIQLNIVHVPTCDGIKKGDTTIIVAPVYIWDCDYDDGLLVASSVRAFMDYFNGFVSPYENIKVDYARFFADMDTYKWRVWILDSEVDAFVSEYHIPKDLLKITSADADKVAEYKSNSLMNTVVGGLPTGTLIEQFPKRSVLTLTLAFGKAGSKWDDALGMSRVFSGWRKFDPYEWEEYVNDYFLVKDGYISKDDLSKIDIYGISTLNNGTGDKIAFTSAGLVLGGIADVAEDKLRVVFFSDADPFIHEELNISKQKSEPWGRIRNFLETGGVETIENECVEKGLYEDDDWFFQHGGWMCKSDLEWGDMKEIMRMAWGDTNDDTKDKEFYDSFYYQITKDKGWRYGAYGNSREEDAAEFYTSSGIVWFVMVAAGYVDYYANAPRDTGDRFDVLYRILRFLNDGYHMYDDNARLTLYDCPELALSLTRASVIDFYTRYVAAIASLTDLDTVYPLEICLAKDKIRAIAELCGVSELCMREKLYGYR